ncbi:MAG TPA: histidine kinase dimerization/phosphoacceptor domain -containing protein, partial [Crenalkalicoccus sp.]|nr:histidine kinase dimerization/phosphoacceptor domain -containing protein [Crenalkalicoccus sp.]
RLALRVGGWRWFRVQGAPVCDAAGRLHHWVGSCTDVEDRHRAAEAQAALTRAADHRVKNSLQLMAALLRLQAGRMAEPAAREALRQAVARVQAVAEAHRALERSRDLRRVPVADLLAELAAGASVLRPGADLRTDAPRDLMLDAERAIPLALMLAELVGAALQRAGTTGPVQLAARAQGGRLEAWVEDDGAELATGMAELVVGSLARQIGAKVALRRLPGGGGQVVVTLPLQLPVAVPEDDPAPASG